MTSLIFPPVTKMAFSEEEKHVIKFYGAPAHRAGETVALLMNETSDFINPTL